MPPVGTTQDLASYMPSMDLLKPMPMVTNAGQMKSLSLSELEAMVPLSVLTTAGITAVASSHGSYFRYGSNSKGDKKPIRRVRRRRWKKEKGKPKRPLSAYNLFFRDERELTNENQPTQKLGFAAMGRMVASKWKHLEPEKRKVYEERAKVERDKYFDALETWKKKIEDEKKEKEAEEKQAAAKLDSVSMDDHDFYSSFVSTGDDALVTHGLDFGLNGDDESVLDVSVDPFSSVANGHKNNQGIDNTFLTDKLQKALDCSVKEDVFTESSLNLIKGTLITDDVIHPSSRTESQQSEKERQGSVSTDTQSKFQEELPDKTALAHPYCAHYGCLHCPKMKRIIKTFETLRHTIDDEFVSFMSNLDWTVETITCSSTLSPRDEETSEKMKMEENKPDIALKIEG